MRTHHVYLIPGFFGFVNFGRLVYFSHVREFLDAALHRRGVRAEIHRVRVSPAASVRRRAADLAECIAETAPTRSGPIHLIGHSTGGLDARLFASPGTNLDTDVEREALASRVKTITTVSCPNHGTPLASLFSSILGQKALQIVSLATVTILRNGRLPVSMLAQLGAAIAGMGLPGGKAEAVLDHLYAEMVGRVPGEDRDQLQQFFGQVSNDQALVSQLTPEGVDLFNAGAADRDTVRYGSVVSLAPRPSLRSHFRFGFRAYEHTTYQLFRWLHGRVGGMPEQYLSGISAEQRRALLAVYSELPRANDSDGIVPTLSQLHGQVIHATRADHLDVIGHFDDERHVPPHHDWICSGSGFNRRAFESLWDDVARFIARNAR